MGGILRAKCDCGFESENIFAGGGMENHASIDMEPALCIDCHLFLVKNHYKKYARCPKCNKKVIFYDDPRLRIRSDNTKKEDSHTFREWQWGGFKLPNSKYLCPKCGRMHLTFYVEGCWD